MTEPTHQAMEGDAALPATDNASLDRLKRFGGGKLLGEMIALFLASAPERLAAAHAGFVSQDARAVEMALHSLKSSSAQLGALRMQRICEHGEGLAKAGTLTEVSSLLQLLNEEFPRVQEWLERARQTEVA
ncbi:MAG: Hpt domain-containing protein [Gemmatimonadaceae bacterium]